MTCASSPFTTSLPVDRDDLHGLGDALELDGAWARGPVGRLLHCLAADQDFRRPRNAGDPRRLVNALAAVVLADLRGVGKMDADADARPETVLASLGSKCSLDRNRATESFVGRLEIDEEAIAGGHHLVSLVRGKKAAQRLVVPLE